MNSKQEQTAREPNINNVLIPSVDILEDKSGITLLLDIPGVPKDAVTVKVDGDMLTIEGEIRLPFPQELQTDYAEVRAGAYRRSFTLSTELDPDHSESVLKNGVLKLRIPKTERALKRKIDIRVE